MQKQQMFLIIIGIGLALIATFAVKVYLDQQQKIIMEDAKRKLEKIQSNQTAVLVAKQDIPRGAVIDPSALETKIVPNDYVQPRAATTSDRVAGMVVVADISRGEQITLNKLTQPRSGSSGGLAEVTPVGKRAVTISVDNIASLGGMIKPGDYVDVIAMIPVPVQGPDGKQVNQLATLPLFQNVLVLAKGQETGFPVRDESRYKQEERKDVPSSLITLALAPQEANLVTFVQEQGKIRLTLRSPTDAKIENVQAASWETLFQYLFPKEREQVKPESPKDYVEIYRGLSKERVPLAK